MEWPIHMHLPLIDPIIICQIIATFCIIDNAQKWRISNRINVTSAIVVFFRAIPRSTAAGKCYAYTAHVWIRLELVHQIFSSDIFIFWVDFVFCFLFSFIVSIECLILGFSVNYSCTRSVFVWVSVYYMEKNVAMPWPFIIFMQLCTSNAHWTVQSKLSDRLDGKVRLPCTEFCTKIAFEIIHCWIGKPKIARSAAAFG